MHKYILNAELDLVTSGRFLITQYSYGWRGAYEPVHFWPHRMPLHLVVAVPRYYDTAARALWTAP